VQTLRAGAAVLGLRLGDAHIAAFARYSECLIAANRRVNLTSIVEPAAVETRHFLDSLTCAVPLLARWGQPETLPALRCIDVGSGAGLPGLALKLALPQLSLTLVEATGKKAAFLVDLVDALALDGVEVYAERAETLAHRPDQRGTYDVALARALAPLTPLLELTLPFLRVGGVLVAPRRGDDDAARTAAGEASRVLGGGPLQIVPVAVEPLTDGRVLAVVDKLKPTPVAYPRRPGQPARRPLGSRMVR
jgi:16S rRNA (guanine527-N7)-methyltransferase